MSHITHRPYAGHADLPAMKAILTANLAAGWGSYHRGDLDWLIFPQIYGVAGEKYELWFRGAECHGAECLGYVIYLDSNADYDVILAPDWRGSSLERELVAWADARMARVAEKVGKKRVAAYCFTDNDSLRRTLGERGYEEHDDVILYAQRLDAGPLPPIALPAGFRFLPAMRPEWAAARAAAHADAFRPSQITPAAYRRFLRDAPDYVGALDVVAVAPDGQHAAFAMAWLDEEVSAALFEPVGTRYEFQRRGLGRAVLREGLRRLQARGMKEVMVGCEADKPGNMAFYEGAGFHERWRILSCQRQLAD